MKSAVPDQHGKSGATHGTGATKLLPVRNASAGIGHDQQRAARLRQPILEKWKRRGVTVGRVGEHVAVALADETLLRCVGGLYFQEGARLKGPLGNETRHLPPLATRQR